MLQDIHDNNIAVGDIVVFTKPGAGRNLPPLVFGEVVAITKASVKVHYLNKDYTRIQREERVNDYNREPRYIYGDGQKLWHQVETGRFVDTSPDSVKWYKDRFMIVGKV